MFSKRHGNLSCKINILDIQSFIGRKILPVSPCLQKNKFSNYKRELGDAMEK